MGKVYHDAIKRVIITQQQICYQFLLDTGIGIAIKSFRFGGEGVWFKFWRWSCMV